LNRIEGERQVCEGTLFSQHPRHIVLFALSALFQQLPGSSGRFHPKEWRQNGAGGGPDPAVSQPISTQGVLLEGQARQSSRDGRPLARTGAERWK
jgi:hypothetical protein